jgi:hypothetical protein
MALAKPLQRRTISQSPPCEKRKQGITIGRRALRSLCAIPALSIYSFLKKMDLRRFDMQGLSLSELLGVVFQSYLA